MGFKKNDSHIEFFLQPNLLYFCGAEKSNEIKLNKNQVYLIDNHLDFVKKEVSRNLNLTPEGFKLNGEEEKEKTVFQFAKPKSQ